MHGMMMLQREFTRFCSVVFECVVLAVAVVTVVPAVIVGNPVGAAARLVIVVIGIGLLGVRTGDEEFLGTWVSEVG